MPARASRRYSHAQHEHYNPFSWKLLLQALHELYHHHLTPEMTVYAWKTLRDLIFMGIELLTENTMIQIISSMQHDRTPLRDPAEEYFSDPNRIYYEFAYLGESTYQVDTGSVLLLWVFYCFLHGTYGLKVLQKGVRCLTMARTLRVLTFSLTILPNPNINCTFPGPIDPFNLSPGGACNDLLYSGHVIVYTISALAVTILCSLYPFSPLRYSLRIFIWMQVLQRMIRAIIELHHYSVDMFLGLFVTLLMWHAEILYYDLPVVPQPLYPHLKKLLFPYDHDGAVDRAVEQLILIYRRFKRQPWKTLNSLIQNQDCLKMNKIRLKQV